MKNYYDILGVERSASQEDIKKAYRKLARRYHPDVNSGNSADEKVFKEINEAYHTLSNDSLRKEYDARLNEINVNSKSRPKKNEADKSSKGAYPGFDIKDIEKNFEHYFGFNPKTGETTLNKEVKSNSSENPLDTTALFNKYFNIRKK